MPSAVAARLTSSSLSFASAGKPGGSSSRADRTDASLAVSTLIHDDASCALGIPARAWTRRCSGCSHVRLSFRRRSHSSVRHEPCTSR